MNAQARRLLWLDCGAGAAAGVVMIALAGWLSALERVPESLLLGMGAVNLAYAAWSGAMAVGAARGQWPARWRVSGLIAANGAWAVVCVALLVPFGAQATAFGWAHLLGEAVFVGGLAAVEWRRLR